MKHIIILLMLPCAAFSQLTKLDTPKRTEIGKIRKVGTFVASLEYYLDESDTTYALTYNDMTYTKITSLETIYFTETGGTLNALYDAIAKAETAEKNAESTFALGKEMIMLVTKRMMGQNYVNVIVQGKGYFNIEEKFLDRLFGRKKD